MAGMVSNTQKLMVLDMFYPYDPEWTSLNLKDLNAWKIEASIVVGSSLVLFKRKLNQRKSPLEIFRYDKLSGMNDVRKVKLDSLPNGLDLSDFALCVKDNRVLLTGGDKTNHYDLSAETHLLDPYLGRWLTTENLPSLT